MEKIDIIKNFKRDIVDKVYSQYNVIGSAFKCVDNFETKIIEILKKQEDYYDIIRNFLNSYLYGCELAGNNSNHFLMNWHDNLKKFIEFLNGNINKSNLKTIKYNNFNYYFILTFFSFDMISRYFDFLINNEIGSQ